jgi:hypothetical protein
LIVAFTSKRNCNGLLHGEELGQVPALQGTKSAMGKTSL